MNWTPIYAALQAAAALTGIPPAAIAWVDQPSADAWTLGPRLRMQIASLHGLGFDDEERVDNPAANQTVTVVGQRQFVWQVRCEVQNSDPATVAIGYLDKLRARLQRTTTELDILLPAGLAMVDIHPTVQVPNVKDSRVISTYLMEVVLACAENDVDDSTDAGTWIQSVGITSNKLKLPDGTDAPEQISITVVGP